MSGHVETVTVSRCGDWFEGLCPGDERGCTRCLEPWDGPFATLADYDLYCVRGEADAYSEEERRRWKDQPFPTEVSHREFIQQYGRCPDGCVVAEQLELTA